MKQLVELGLRERKKATTKLHIQRQALALFAVRGYDATTIEQIVDAADVSQSTFFRYFPTKEAVVLYRSLDISVVDTLGSRDSNNTVVGAFRVIANDVFSGMSPDRAEIEMQRIELIRSVPKLRAMMFDDLLQSVDVFASIISRYTGLATDNPTVRTIAGAIAGVIAVTVMDVRSGNTMSEFMKSVDIALAQLEKSMKL